MRRSLSASVRPAAFRRSLLTPLVLAAALAAAPASPAFAGVDSFGLWAGAFDVLDSGSSTEVGAEVVFGSFAGGDRPVRWALHPAVGVMGTTDDAIYAHAGFRLELPVGERWTVSIQEAAGWYDRGEDKDLGGDFQFRSGIEAAVDLSPRHSLGLLFYHLSNAGIDDRNPGAESLVVTWRLGF